MADIEQIRADKLSPGDIVEVNQGDFCPADIVLIKGKNISVMLDGAYETKDSIKFTRSRLPNYQKIIHFQDYAIKCQEPGFKEFYGLFVQSATSIDIVQREAIEPIDESNVIWAGSEVHSKALGVVVYAGSDTKNFQE